MTSSWESIEMKQSWPERFQPTLSQGHSPSNQRPNASEWDDPTYPASYLNSQETHNKGSNLHHRPLLLHQPESTCSRSQSYTEPLDIHLSSTKRESSRGLFSNSEYTALQPRIDNNGYGPIDIAITTQKPKRITRTGWTRHFWRTLIHVPAICASLIAIVVGITPLYWYPAEGAVIRGELIRADIIANSLQLATKLHEILIVISLSTIVLSVFRCRLIGGGVRLGFLTGGYRVGDLAYLCKAAFRQHSIDRSRPWELLLSGFLVFATIMSSIVGPASAVLLVPTLGWYGFDTLPLVYNNMSHEVWTTHFRDYTDVYQYCETMDGTMAYPSYCLATGYSELKNWAGEVGATELANNITFQSTSTDIRRHLSTTQRGSRTISTTPPHFLMDSIGLFQQFIDTTHIGAALKEPRYRLTSKGANQYQPFVQSICETHLFNTSNINPSFKYPVDLDCFGDADCEHIISQSPSLEDVWPNATYHDNSGLNMEYATHHDNSSVIFVSGLVPGTQEDQIYLCTLLASWVESTFTYDPQVDDIFQARPSVAENLQKAYDKKFNDKARVIRFDKDWFPKSNPVFNSSDDSLSNTTIGRVMQALSFSATTSGMSINGTTASPPSISLAEVLGSYLTESLSRNPFGAPFAVMKQTTEELIICSLEFQHSFYSGITTIKRFNATHTTIEFLGSTMYIDETFETYATRFNKAVHIGIQAERYGYGSGQRRRMLDFGVAIMCIYLGTVFTYGLVIVVLSVLESLRLHICGGRVRFLSVVPWSDLQDLILLALRTPTPKDPDLADVGAGVTSDQVWKKTVRVRADEFDNVHLVLGDSSGTSALQTASGKKYY